MSIRCSRRWTFAPDRNTIAAIRGGLAAISIAILGLVLAAVANAGGPINPTPGDKQLGKAGGIRYIADTDRTTDQDDAIAYTGCPNVGHQWRLTGGGVTTSASILNISGSQPADLSSFFGDDDTDVDDYWRTEVQSSGAGAKFTGFAICAKLKALSYNEVFVQPSAVSPTTVTDPCPGRTEPTGGGGSSGFTGRPIISMYPDGGSWTFTFDDMAAVSTFAYNDYICFSPKGTKTVTNSGKIRSLASKSVEARCPKKTNVVGGGVELGSPQAGSVFASFPIDKKDKGKVPDDGWRAGVQSTTTQRQSLKVYAICKKG